ncbi:MAG: M1 family metallopeptidase [Bacteroidota bacterium]
MFLKHKVSLLATAYWFLSFSVATSQGYWQQHVDYKMDIDFDVATNQFTGSQKLTYTNNSPDTLHKAFFHLYFNAFQPGSMMDVRSRNIEDPNPKVGDRIFYLQENEIGYHNVNSLTQDGVTPDYHTQGTILEVTLTQPILPGGSTVFEMTFDSQVPIQVRRSGRDNKEGIRYSMAQWFPKIAEYDKQGWHAHPYVGREFFAPWGDYDVTLSIDKDYVVAATGILQNPNEIGHGYEDEGVKVPKVKGDKLTWQFKAENVHDFLWAADPDYKHIIAQVPDGPKLHFFYQTDTLKKNWQQLPELTVKAFQFINENFGKYPYPKYSIIQGGDGGMEYPMATLITGHRSLPSLVGVTVHEALHSWYQGVLATNESYYAWMDEGFTSYASSLTMGHIFGGDRLARNYSGYYSLAYSGKEEPLSTHADHFMTNTAPFEYDPKPYALLVMKWSACVLSGSSLPL